MKWIAPAGDPTGHRRPDLDSPGKLQNTPPMADSRPTLRPLRWLAHLPLAILPMLAAGVIDGPRLERDLQARVAASLAAAGAGWASVTPDGRDIEIRGTAPDVAAVHQAMAAVSATFGVRRVVAHVGTRPLP